MKTQREQREGPQHFQRYGEESLKGIWAIHTSPLTIWGFYSYLHVKFPLEWNIPKSPLSHFSTICYLSKPLWDFRGYRSHIHLHIFKKLTNFISFSLPFRCFHAFLLPPYQTIDYVIARVQDAPIIVSLNILSWLFTKEALTWAKVLEHSEIPGYSC